MFQLAFPIIINYISKTLSSLTRRKLVVLVCVLFVNLMKPSQHTMLLDHRAHPGAARHRNWITGHHGNGMMEVRKRMMQTEAG